VSERSCEVDAADGKLSEPKASDRPAAATDFPSSAPLARPLVQAAAGSHAQPPRWLRLWLRTPDGVFRALGALFFFGYAAVRMRDYFTDFPNVGHYWCQRDALGHVIPDSVRYLPLAKILIDLTFLLIALSFIFRLSPRQRAATPRQIIIPLIAWIWPLLPFMLQGLLQLAGNRWSAPLDRMLDYGAISYEKFYFGVMLLCIGNALDVWAYGTLFRSVSIVAEARSFKCTGPYALIRHPIYLGQFIAQAGVWLVLVRLHLAWVIFYLLFVAMQLYRAKVEEEVLEQTFGEEFRAWKQRTFWFFP